MCPVAVKSKLYFTTTSLDCNSKKNLQRLSLGTTSWLKTMLSPGKTVRGMKMPLVLSCRRESAAAPTAKGKVQHPKGTSHLRSKKLVRDLHGQLSSGRSHVRAIIKIFYFNFFFKLSFYVREIL